jgi:hypothetical protein
MSGGVKAGLIVGLVGMVINLVVSLFLGICGPVVTLLAGGVAGFFAARFEGPGPRMRSAQAGAVAGLVAGVLMFISQTVAALAVVLLMQAAGIPGLTGQIPAGATPSMQAVIVVSALGTGACFGVVGLALAALAGATGGYLGGSGETA